MCSLAILLVLLVYDSILMFVKRLAISGHGLNKISCLLAIRMGLTSLFKEAHKLELSIVLRLHEFF